jgi:hypothetical protein
VKLLAFALGLFAVLACAQNGPASLPPQKVLAQPTIYIPPEAAVSAAGGPAVVLAEKAKPVEYEMIPGGPCGGGVPYDSGMTNPVRSEPRGTQPASTSGSEPGGIGLWLPIGSGVAAVAGIGLIGFWLLRRSRM